MLSRTFAAGLALALALAGPAHAEDGPSPTVEKRAPSPPEIDLSRQVTLTGAELQAMIAAEVAAERARAAAQAAAGVSEKIRAALTVPAPEPAKP